MEKFTKMFLPVTSFVGVILLFLYLGQYGVTFSEILGISITLVGYVLWFYGRYQLGPAYSLLPEARHIVSNGIYSKIRHPLYISQMITLGGVIFFIGDHRLWLLFFYCLIIQVYRKIQEEKLLINKFGTEYTNYIKTTWF